MRNSSFWNAARGFYFGDLDSQDFLKELYRSEAELEEQIGAEKTFELLGCDLKTKEGKEKAKGILRACYSSDSSRLYVDRAIDVCERHLKGEIGVESAVKLLAELELAGCDFIPVVFSGYDSEIDDGVDFSFYGDRAHSDILGLLKALKCWQQVQR